MKLIEEVISANFRAAFKYVQTNYAYLFHPSLKAVKLLSKEHHDRLNPNAGGLYLRRENASIITAKYGFRTETYVEILVHELTHLQQFTSGRAFRMSEEQLEAEAYPAGRTARGLYEHQELLELTKDMRRRKAA